MLKKILTRAIKGATHDGGKQYQANLETEEIMKLQFEKEIFRHLKEVLDEKFRSMLVMEHTTYDSFKPYISVDCEDEKPFEDLSLPVKFRKLI